MKEKHSEHKKHAQHMKKAHDHLTKAHHELSKLGMSAGGKEKGHHKELKSPKMEGGSKGLSPQGHMKKHRGKGEMG